MTPWGGRYSLPFAYSAVTNIWYLPTHLPKPLLWTLYFFHFSLPVAPLPHHMSHLAVRVIVVLRGYRDEGAREGAVRQEKGQEALRRGSDEQGTMVATAKRGAKAARRALAGGSGAGGRAQGVGARAPPPLCPLVALAETSSRVARGLCPGVSGGRRRRFSLFGKIADPAQGCQMRDPVALLGPGGRPDRGEVRLGRVRPPRLRARGVDSAGGPGGRGVAPPKRCANMSSITFH